MPSLLARVRTCLSKRCVSKKATSMNGQWIGHYSGTNMGILVADLDDVGTSYAGEIYVYDNNSGYPRTFAFISLPKDRGGPGCLNSFSASISGASAGVRLPSGVAAG
jgi:hypothetical protein